MPNYLEKLGNRVCHVIRDIPQIPNEEMSNLKLQNDLQSMIAELRIIKDEIEI
jgi:hypothetical protein